MHLRRGTVGEGEKGMGRNGGVSLQPTRDQSGREFAPRLRGGIPSKHEGSSRNKGRNSKQKGISKRIGACTSVNIVLIKDCV
jgi:hypothetical protein